MPMKQRTNVELPIDDVVAHACVEAMQSTRVDDSPETRLNCSKNERFRRSSEWVSLDAVCDI